MLFNSIDFLFFFPVVLWIYFIIPKKVRYIWLFITSYYFYMSWNPKYALLIALSTFITYLSGVFIEYFNGRNCERGKQICVAGSLISNLGILGLFKYSNFIIMNLSRMFAYIGSEALDWQVDLLLPVGISFYTFQALSYTIDVYRGELKAEKNIVRYALFVSFFPQLVAGPIERSKNLLTQLQKVEEIRVWSFSRVRDGFLLMMWGYFQKLIIADRAAMLVNNVFNGYEKYGFVEISIAIILFAFQIYCDFDGYTNIARGAAQIMGFSLMKNFRQPYLALSIKDFWRRWHISLTSWFTDYLYIPLGGNRKGPIRKYMNTAIVFLVSGLWHGASWNFVIWGGIHAVFLIVEDIRYHLERKLGWERNTNTICKRIGNSIFTFILVDFAWIFFASSSFTHAKNIIIQMMTVIQTTNVLDLGFNRVNWFLMLAGILVLLVVDILHEKKISILATVNQQNIIIRWSLYLGLVWFVIMFGIYGVNYDASTFIYFQF